MRGAAIAAREWEVTYGNGVVVRVMQPRAPDGWVIGTLYILWSAGYQLKYLSESLIVATRADESWKFVEIDEVPF